MWKFRSMESEDRPASPIHPSRSSLWSQSVGWSSGWTAAHAPRPLGWPGGSLVWSWPLEGPAYEILFFTVPQVPNLLGHLVISSNSDEGILVPSPLHDDYSTEKGQDLKEYH